MTATINLTAVLITLIICETLYALCKLANKEKAKAPEVFLINSKLKLLFITTTEKRYEINTNTAPTYPILLIT